MSTTGSWWLSALVVSIAGCGGSVVVDGSTDAELNPLVGSWVSTRGGTIVVTENVTFTADGTSTATDTYALIGVDGGKCAGALTFTESWTSTPSTVSTWGAMCTGQVSCPNGNMIVCAPTDPEACTYTLSDGDDTLVLNCPQLGPNTFIRTM